MHDVNQRRIRVGVIPPIPICFPQSQFENAQAASFIHLNVNVGPYPRDLVWSVVSLSQSGTSFFKIETRADPAFPAASDKKVSRSKLARRRFEMIRMMETRRKRRRSYARKSVELAIVSRYKRAANCQARTAFLELISTFHSAATLPADTLNSGYAASDMIDVTFEALGNLAKANKWWIRDPWTWTPPQQNSFRPRISSLIRHLLAKSDVPTFMDYVWWSDEHGTQRYQTWFLHLAAGNSIRGIEAAGIKSKPQEQRFLTAPDHFSIEQAVAWSSKSPTESRIRQVYPSGLSRRRQKRIPIRSPKLWKRIGVSDYIECSERFGILRLWQIRQILCAQKLVEEGTTMQHCVGGYRKLCEEGKTTIWSMTCKNLDDQYRKKTRALTIEVLPRKTITEALGLKNREPKIDEMEVIHRWAEKEKLKIDLC